MKKILILVIFLSSFLFSEDWTDCCKSPLYVERSYTSSDQETVIVSRVESSHYDVVNGYTVSSSVPDEWQSQESECIGEDFVGYSYGNASRTEGTDWVETVDLIKNIIHVPCACSEESTPLTELPELDNTIEHWELVANKSCLDSAVQGDYPRYEETDDTNKTTTSQYQGCCGTSINYYIKASSLCGENQEKDENGVCRDTCGTDGLMIDGECVERASCKEFYRDMTAISVGDTPDCDNPYNSDENRTMYMDIYNLFPNQEVTEDSMLTCCYRDWAKDTDGDGIDDSIDADIDGDGENELEDTDGDGVADAYQDEKNSDNYNPTDGSTTNTDSNTTNTDSNTTNTDSNTTDSTVTNEILKDIQGDLQKGTSDIVNAITEQTTQSHTDSTAIKSSIDSMAEQSHTDSTAIKSSIDSMAEQSHTDLEGIKEGTDVLKDLKEEGETAKQEKEGMSESLNNALSGMSGTYDGLVGKIGELASIGGNAPHFVGSGDSKFQGEVYGKTIVFDFKMVANLRQYIDIIWILLLAYFNFRIYLWIIKFIIKIGV